VISLHTVWELAKAGKNLDFEQAISLTFAQAWYTDKADYGYKRKDPNEVERLFASLGMTGEFWSLGGEEGFR
jgi:hypothetical protein